jgi:Alpha-L-arabinofuranosidase
MEHYVSKVNRRNSFLKGLWMLLFIPAFSFAQTNPQTFFLDSWAPKTISVAGFDTVAQTIQTPTVTVNIDADSVIARVSKYVFGHNAAGWGGFLNQSTQLVKDLNALQPQIIRWPGGSSSDNYMWKATSQATCPKDLPPTFSYVDLVYGSNTSSWTMPTSAYYDLLSKTNSTGIITVNYGYARYGTGTDPVRTAAKYAADWVRYDNGRTRYWEIGNENFGNWESGYTIDQTLNKDGQPKTISGDLYGKHCKIFIEEMRKAAQEVGNDIKIGVVAMDGYVSYDAVQGGWNAGMMKQVGNLADYFIVHHYYGPWNENSNVSTILNSYSITKDIMTYVNNGLKSALNKSPIPVLMTEYNINATGSAQGCSYVNGMHGALVVGELIKNQYGGGMRWDFMNGWDNGDNMGLFADGEPGIARYTPRAPFFYLYYFEKYFGDRMVLSSVSGSSDVVAYASRFSSGQSSAVLVNKGTTNQVVTVKLRNFKPGKNYYYYILTGGTDHGDFSPKVYVNGKTSANTIGGPSDYATMKPYGNSITGDITIELPKLATAFLLADNDTSLLNQSINFDTIPGKTVGDTDFQITASATSNLPVVFSSSNSKVATVKNGTVHIVGAGNCTIVATQDGDTVYNVAAPVSQKLTVAKANQIITMDTAATVNYGIADFTISASASSGLPLGFKSATTSVATIVNGMVHVTGVGTSNITASQAGNVNYNPAVSMVQALTVNKGNQTITFNSLPAKKYGDVDFAPGATASSNLVCTYTSDNTDVATIVNNSVHIVGPGTSLITASQAGNINYNPAIPSAQTLTVGKANQTITFTSLPVKKVTDVDFAPGATASSKLICTYTSDNPDVATIVNDSVHIVGAGTAKITAHQAGDTFYNAAADVTVVLSVIDNTGINEISTKTGFEIYPNPAGDFVKVKQHSNPATVEIYNVLGKEVYKKQSTNSVMEIPVDEIGGAGVYFIKVNSVVKKFSIVK